MIFWLTPALPQGGVRFSLQTQLNFYGRVCVRILRFLIESHSIDRAECILVGIRYKRIDFIKP